MVAEADGFSRVVTSTTREPRPGEVNGRDYHFFSGEEFDQRVAANAFLEWAWVHRKNRYGTLTSSVLEPLTAGQSLIINVDVQGVNNFRQAAQENPLLARHMGTVYVDVPIDELRVRLQGRGDSESEIEGRMITAIEEQKERNKFDYVITSSTKEADFTELMKVWQRVKDRVESA